MKRILKRAKLIAVIFIIVISIVPSPIASASSCRDVDIIFARGSGQDLGVTDPQQEGYPAERNELFRSLQAALDSDPTLTVGYLDLAAGMENTTGKYEAVSVAGGETAWKQFISLLNSADAAIRAQTLAFYNGSVNGGVNLLVEYISNKSAECPNTRYVLAGYSQGAHVIGDALNDDRLASYLPKISYTALFGDPKSNAGTNNSGEGVPSEDIAWHTDGSVLYQGNKGGVLRPRYPYLPDNIKYRAGSWCLSGDAICYSYYPAPSLSDLANNQAHLSYSKSESNVISEAVFAIASQLRSDIDEIIGNGLIAPNLSTMTYPNCNNAKIDVAILMDGRSTMSTDPLFRSTAANVRNILNTSCDTRMAVIEFGAMTDQDNVNTISHFTRSSAATAQALLASRNSQTGGSYVETALRPAMLHALNLPGWRPDSEKAILIITDSVGDGYPTGTVEWQAHNIFRQQPIFQQILHDAKELGGVGVHVAPRFSGPSHVTGGLPAYYRAFVSSLGGYTAIGSPETAGNQITGCFKVDCTWSAASLYNFDDQVNKKPNATVPTAVNGQVGSPVDFSVSNVTSGPFLSPSGSYGVQWDLNCDGVFEEKPGDNLTITRTIMEPRSCKAGVKVNWNTYSGNRSQTSYRYEFFDLNITL